MARIHISSARLFLYFNLAFLAAVFIAGLNPRAFRSASSQSSLSQYNGRYLSVSGRVCEEADVDIKSRRLTLCTAGGRALITANLYPAYNYGDFLKVSGNLKAPGVIEDFDYCTYLARYDIYSVMYYPKVETALGTLSGPQRLFLWLLKGKWRIKEIMEASLPEPEAGLGTALLLGYNRTVEKSDLQLFSRVGLSHMIAISGSHITILSALIINFLLAVGFNRRRALKAVFAFLFLYPLLTGLAASAVRSSIMGGLTFIALYLGRASAPINALLFSASLMILFNPHLLRADVGFQLSFLAVLGIIYLYPLAERWYAPRLERLKKSRKKRIIKIILDTINLTMVSQIITLPILLINFQQWSLVAPLANVLVLWTFGPLLAALILGTLIAGLLPFLGVWPFLPAYVLLKFIFITVGALAQPSWAAINVSGFNWG